MSRLFFLALLAVLALVKIQASEVSGPIPAGLELPVIDHPINSNRAAREKVRVLSNLVANEPSVVKNFEKEQAAAAAAAAEDTWNGEEDPEGNHNLAHQADLKEMKALQKLIVHGKKILRVLPNKIKRLNALKAKAAKFLGVKAKREALEKLEKQESLLNAIRAKENAVAKRLKSLHLSQNKLSGSINKIKKILGNKKGKKGKKGKKAPKAAPRTAPKPASFVEAENSADAEVEAEAEAQVEQQTEETFVPEAEAAEPQVNAEEFNLADL